MPRRSCSTSRRRTPQRMGSSRCTRAATPRPATSNFNPVAGQITHNLVHLEGRHERRGVHVHLRRDRPDRRPQRLPPVRLGVHNRPPGNGCWRTRTGQPGGQHGYSSPTKPAAGSTIELQVTATPGANLPADTKAVFLNITTVNSDAAGWLVAYPCGTPRPASASNVNPAPRSRPGEPGRREGRRRREGLPVHVLVDRHRRRSDGCRADGLDVRRHDPPSECSRPGSAKARSTTTRLPGRSPARPSR